MKTNLKPITSRFSVNESKHLGKGCYGNVYEGYDNETNKKIAVKHLNKPENYKD
jgi:serine/threonine protein kinase